MGQLTISRSTKVSSSIIKMLAVTCFALVVLSPAVLGGYASHKSSHQPSHQCHTEYETVTSYEQQCSTSYEKECSTSYAQECSTSFGQECSCANPRWRLRWASLR